MGTKKKKSAARGRRSKKQKKASGTAAVCAACAVMAGFFGLVYQRAETTGFLDQFVNRQQEPQQGIFAGTAAPQASLPQEPQASAADTPLTPSIQPSEAAAPQSSSDPAAVVPAADHSTAASLQGTEETEEKSAEEPETFAQESGSEETIFQPGNVWGEGDLQQKTDSADPYISTAGQWPETNPNIWGEGD